MIREFTMKHTTAKAIQRHKILKVHTSSGTDVVQKGDWVVEESGPRTQ